MRRKRITQAGIIAITAAASFAAGFFIHSMFVVSKNDYNEAVLYSDMLEEQNKDLKNEIKNLKNTKENVTETETNADNSQETVWITQSGKKYHKSGCYHLKKGGTQISMEEALADNRTPCKSCFKE